MTAAAPLALTLDTLTWDEAVTIGMEAWNSAEQSKWDLGDVGNIVAHKWQADSVKKFANEIGMFDNPRRLYEYVQVANHYPKSARAQFPTVTWSAFREASRHGLTPEQSLAVLSEHGDKPVAAIRRAITGSNTKRATFDIHAFVSWSSDGPRVIMDLLEQQRLYDLLTAHPDATIRVTVEYQDAA